MAQKVSLAFNVFKIPTAWLLETAQPPFDS